MHGMHDMHGVHGKHDMHGMHGMHDRHKMHDMHDIHDPGHRSRLTDHDRPTARVRARPRARKYLVTPLERGIMTQERIHPIHDHPPGRSGRSAGRPGPAGGAVCGAHGARVAAGR